MFFILGIVIVCVGLDSPNPTLALIGLIPMALQIMYELLDSEDDF